MDADAFHGGDGAAGGHLRAVDGGGREGFVVGLEGADAVVQQEVADVAEGVEEAGDGGAGIAGIEADAAFGFEAAFDQQFVAGEDFAAGVGQKRGSVAIAVCPSAGPWRHPGSAWLTNPPKGRAAGDAVWHRSVRDSWPGREFMADQAVTRGAFDTGRTGPGESGGIVAPMRTGQQGKGGKFGGVHAGGRRFPGTVSEELTDRV